MTELATCEAGTSALAATFAATKSTSFAIALAAATEAAEAVFGTTGAACDVCGVRLALLLIPTLVKADRITFFEIVVIRDIVAVGEEILTTTILHDKPKALCLVEELHGTSLAHGFREVSVGRDDSA